MPDLALLANTTPRIVEILNANPEATTWAGKGAVSGRVGAFVTDDEIVRATIESDGELVTRGYFNSINKSLAEPFMSVSNALAPGARVPSHYGNVGKVELAAAVAYLSTADINTTTDVITATLHGAAGIITGKPISFVGTPPAPLVANTTYYAIRVTASTIKVATTADNANAGTAIDLTTTGSGAMVLIEWQDGVETDSADDIKHAIATMEDYVEADAYDYLYKVESNILYFSATHGRIEVPSYTRTAVLQGNKADEPIIIAGAVALLMKHSSPAMFAEWSAKAERGIASILRDGSYEPGNPNQNP